MLRLRRHWLPRVLVYVFLTWTAVDLLAPQLCAEEVTAGDDLAQRAQAPPSPDDCFCCCQFVDLTRFTVVLVEQAVEIVETFSAVEPLAGVQSRLYHPPLSA